MVILAGKISAYFLNELNRDMVGRFELILFCANLADVYWAIDQLGSRQNFSVPISPENSTLLQRTKIPVTIGRTYADALRISKKNDGKV